MNFLSTSTLKMSRLSLVLVLVLLALSTFARAEDIRYYDVETIIFESLDPAARNAENWKAEVTPQTPPVSVELDQPYPGTMPAQLDPNLTFKSLPASDYQLNDAEKQMVDSKQYRILLHTAWVQPGLGPDAALPVHIVRSFVSDTPVTHSLIPAGPDAPPANLPTQGGDTQTRSVLDAYIKIILTRYLHADVDIRYTTGLPLTPTPPQAGTMPGSAPSAKGAPATTTVPPSENPAAADTTPGGPAVTGGTAQAQASGADANAPGGLPAPVTYVLHQSRKMRSNVLHYLDHPVLGMLLIIRPHGGNK